MNEDNQLNAVAQVDIDTSTLGKVTITLPAHLAEHAERVKVDYTVLPKNVYDSIVRCPRDKRTMNHMDPETKAIHIRLEQWGAETRENLSGYPPVTLLGRLIEQGPMGASQTGRPPVSLSEPAAHIDACVGKLCKIDQRALKYYYQAQISREVLARKMSMRERQAQNVLRRARWRVAAHLAVMEG